MSLSTRVKRIGWSLTAAASLVLAGSMATGSATANVASMVNTACDVVIYEYGHNAPGADTASNRNSEFIRLVNRGTAPVEVEGWWVQDDFPHIYKLEASKLPAGSPFNVAGKFTMPVGSSVYLYNGSGVDTSPTSTTAAIYRNVSHHFNNSGDTLSLKRTDGKTISFEQYTSFREKDGPLSCPA